jgi:hypothetical protein
VTQEERAAQLASLKQLLEKVRPEPLMGEMAPALLKMLDGGKIDFEAVRRGKKQEKVFAAKVTPHNIARLLPLVTHPSTYPMFRFFLEGLLYIRAVRCDEKQVKFGSSDALLNLSERSLGQGVYKSGVADPPSFIGAMERAVSERAVAEALGCSSAPTNDGWLRLYIGDQSVGVEPVVSSQAPLTYRSLEDVKNDIVVVTYPDAATATVHVLGWTDRGAIARHRRKKKNGGVNHVLLPSKLFEFQELVALAERTPSRGLQ